jgi:hypothetical protein
MMKVSVNADIAQAMKLLEGLPKQIPYATMLAINASAEDAKEALVNEMSRAFDRPTPYTKNGLRIKYATKARLEAEILVKDKASGVAPLNFLYPEVESGPRKRKGFELLLSRAGILPGDWYAIPTSYAPQDGFGNIPNSTMVAILKQLQSLQETDRNEKAANKQKYNRTKRTGRYFALKPTDPSLGKRKPGIYERLSTGFGGSARPIFIFTSKQPKYRDRYHFYQVGQAAASAAMSRRAVEAVEKAIATAK